MSSNIAPIPVNEMNRILNLYEFDLDYSNLENTFKDLTYLAAKICGTDISVFNLIDSYTQWSISSFGLDAGQTPREDSLCQYTILENDHFEVEDLSLDSRFQDKSFVDNPLNLRYYFGVPLRTNSGHNIGSLCVLDKDQKKLTPEKIELLKIIANEIIKKLNTIKVVQELKVKITEEKEVNKRVAHDIRGPISGIIGLTEIIKEDSKETETLELVNMINKSGNAVLDLADDILNQIIGNKESMFNEFSLLILKQKLEKLYDPQAKAKEISFNVLIDSMHENVTFKKGKLLQIAGNLISNAIKFTPNFGDISVNLQIELKKDQNLLIIEVNDNGLGIDEQSINSILKGNKITSVGTNGEMGYGFGLTLIQKLVQSIKGRINIKSELGKGTNFQVIIPI
ncbi:MAG: GAF domain-containing sensor histidine kinase [Sphingobacteriaceae bacterium]|nr:GAF domain-containing sensor histidine kinase [Sphingobacteriaceae bacterium]